MTHQAKYLFFANRQYFLRPYCVKKILEGPFHEIFCFCFFILLLHAIIREIMYQSNMKNFIKLN
jgi:hypothetical protein